MNMSMFREFSHHPALKRFAVLFGIVAMNGASAVLSPSAASAERTPDVLVQVVARERVSVAAGIDGRIQRLTVREGDRFRRGQLLVAFDSATEQGLLDRSTAALELAVKNATAQQRLYEMGSSSKMEVAAAVAERGKASAERKIAAAALDKCAIRAPFSGGVSELMVQQYQSVKKGDPLMRIVNTGNLEIQMFVPSKWLRWLKPGQKFKVHIDELGRDFDAQVRTTGTSIDAVSQSVAVFARFVAQAPELLPGMSGRAIITPQN